MTEFQDLMECFKLALFPRLQETMREIHSEACKLNQFDGFDYKYFHVSPAYISKINYLHPGTKAYLDSVCTDELDKRFKEMEQVLSFLSRGMTRLIRPRHILCLLPEAARELPHLRSWNVFALQGQDEDTIADLRQQPEYELLQSYCLFASMGVS